jgi:anaerobic selenocysteine-containing dehydrogenase
VYDLPESFGFEEALENVERVISFDSSYTKTTMQADYLFPDHTPLEGWGYQRANLDGDRMTISGFQPVIPPLFKTRSTVDLILAATRAMGDEAAASVPFIDEVDFIKKSLTPLVYREGSFKTHSPDLFWKLWRENGGWWEANPHRIPPVVCTSFNHPWFLSEPDSVAEENHKYYLVPFLHTDSTRNDWDDLSNFQQEIGMVNRRSSYTQVEMHEKTARAFGLHNGDVVRISSPSGEIQAVVRQVKTIRPDTIAVYGRTDRVASVSITDGQWSNPLDLLGKRTNESGDLAFTLQKLRIITC